MADKDVQKRIDKIKARIPERWSNCAEKRTAELMEEVLKELVEIKQLLAVRGPSVHHTLPAKRASKKSTPRKPGPQKKKTSP